MPRGRVAVFGDIGGHWAELHAALVGLGMDAETQELPADLTVLQVGDLIHRGPQSPQVLQLVARMLARQPAQWVQLVGNHEALYFPGAPRFSWPEPIDSDDAGLLNSWWANGSMRLAAGVQTEFGPVLVTHAGLTAGLWSILGSPAALSDVVSALNALPSTQPGLGWATGCMLNGDAVNLSAGPVWAESGWELYPSWAEAAANGERVPFGQVHGHSSAWSWRDKKWTGHPELEDYFVVNPRARHVIGVIGSRPFAGIDLGFGKRAARVTWRPLVFTDAEVVAR